MLSLRRRNSLLRNVLRLREVRLSLLLLLTAACLVVASPGAASACSPPAALAAAAVALLLIRRRALVSQAVAAMLRDSLAVQRAALQQHTPDVVVGSSYGGAVAALLLAEGSWAGPTILLAPAFERLTALVQDAAHGATPYAAALDALVARDRDASVPMAILVVHAAADTVVPFAHSEAMAGALPRAVLPLDRGAPGDDHRLLSLGRSAAMQALLDRVCGAWRQASR